MNAVSKFILHCADICKPILLKIIPVKILRKMKGKMILLNTFNFIFLTK